MIPCAVIGATGMVGQRYVELLENHPWFQLTAVCGSDGSAGERLGRFTLQRIEELQPSLLFSCIGGPDVAQIEQQLAERGFQIISNCAAHRSRPDVPVIIPEINPGHLELIGQQPWSGSIVCKPNCSLQSYLIPLHLLGLPIRRVMVSTLQAMSGAGRDAEPVLSPYIAGEEEKSEQEPLKILGSLTEEGVEPAEIEIAAHCNRVPIPDGHTSCVSVEFEEEPDLEEIVERWRSAPSLALPTAPEQLIRYFEAPDRPRPALDLGDGMSIAVGRLRRCPLFHIRFVGLSHNLVRGAAGGGLLTAELMHTQGWFDESRTLAAAR